MMQKLRRRLLTGRIRGRTLRRKKREKVRRRRKGKSGRKNLEKKTGHRKTNRRRRSRRVKMCQKRNGRKKCFRRKKQGKGCRRTICRRKSRLQRSWLKKRRIWVGLPVCRITTDCPPCRSKRKGFWRIIWKMWTSRRRAFSMWRGRL